MNKFTPFFIGQLISFFILFTISIFGQTYTDKPLFNVKHGFFNNPFTLTIRTIEDGSLIKYTLNGTDPSTSSNAFSKVSPVEIKIDPEMISGRDRAPGFIIRACVFKNGAQNSEVISQTYLFPNKVTSLSTNGMPPSTLWPSGKINGQWIDYGLDEDVYNSNDYKDEFEMALNQIPTFSIITDLSNLFDKTNGIYVNALKHGIDWERPASIELLNPNGDDGFTINAGIRIRGGYSRNSNNPKHAFRIFFRGEYGETKLHYPLFGDEGVDEFDKIDLRCSQNYSWAFYGDKNNTMIREVFSRDIQREMGEPYTRSRYYHLYINGTYWGLYQTQERSEANFAKSYFGGSDADYDVVKVDVGENFDIYHVEATDGNLDAYKRLWTAAKNGLSTNVEYFKLQGMNPDGTINPNYEKLLDVDNLIDYMLCTFYTGDFDGPISNFRNNQSPNNFYAIFNRVNPDGFKFFRHDGEHTLGVNANTSDRTGPYPAGENFEDCNPQFIHQQLTQNSEYLKKFSDKVYERFFNGGVFTPEYVQELMNERKNQIYSAVIAESARWGDTKTSPARTRNNDWLPVVNDLIYNYVPSRGNKVISQLISKNWYPSFYPPQFDKPEGIISQGEKVSLSSSAGEIYYTLDGTDPAAITEGDVSTSMLITAGNSKRVLIPNSDIGTEWRSALSYDDSAWDETSGSPGGIGYEKNSGYESLISYDTKNIMAGKLTSCYIRIPFNVNKDIAYLNSLQLSMLYDDGFVAYLNGVQIAKANAPSNLNWNSKSTTDHEAYSKELFDLISYKDFLKQGENLLSIHALNVSLTSSDFLILPELLASFSNDNSGISNSAIKYTNPIVINSTTNIKTRVLSNKKWSAINRAYFIVNENLNNLKLTEINYNPTKRDTTDGDEYEFIELKNIGSKELDLSLAGFIKGINYKFFTGTKLLHGQFIVLASNKIEFEERYGFAPFDQYNGHLSNSGERIIFASASGDTLINVKYSDKFPWPTSADGLGFSLVSKNPNPNEDPADYKYWRASSTIHGSPMKDDIDLNISKVYINEVLAHTDIPQADAIEIYNPNNAAVDISNWFLTDDISKPMKWKIPSNTILSANGYKVFVEGHYVDTVLVSDENEFGSAFSLSSHGDEIYIYSADIDSNLTGYFHGFSFGESINGVSFGRYINGENEEHFPAQKGLSFGKENLGPVVGPIVITQINYDANLSNFEYLRIKNISSFDQILYNPTEINNTWKISGVDFMFPLNTKINSGESIFIIQPGISETEFRKTYTLPISTRVFNYKGTLDNNGETIVVNAPAESYTLNGQVIVPYVEIDKVKYNNKNPWPEDANKSGKAITRISDTEYGNDALNWKSEEIVTDIESENDSFPLEYSLYQNYPNPFNPTTTISYSIPNNGMVKLEVFDVLGRNVKTLISKEQKAGNYSVSFDGTSLSSGVYLYKITSGTFTETKKLILLK